MNLTKDFLQSENLNEFNATDFKKVEMKVGRVKEASKVEKSDKLLLMKIDIGGEERQIVSGIAQFYSPEDVTNKMVVVLVNLEPRMIMGLESEGMVLAAVEDGRPILITPDKDVASGADIC